MKAPPYGGEIRRSHKVCKICGRIALAFVYFNNNLPTRTIVLQFLFFVRVTFLNLRTEFDVIVQSCIVRVYMNASDCHFVSFLAPACMRDIVIPYIVFILFKSCKSFFVSLQFFFTVVVYVCCSNLKRVRFSVLARFCQRSAIFILQ